MLINKKIFKFVYQRKRNESSFYLFTLVPAKKLLLLVSLKHFKINYFLWITNIILILSNFKFCLLLQITFLQFRETFSDIVCNSGIAEYNCFISYCPQSIRSQIFCANYKISYLVEWNWINIFSYCFIHTGEGSIIPPSVVEFFCYLQHNLEFYHEALVLSQ